MHRELEKEEFKIKMTQQLIIAHAKYDDQTIDAPINQSYTEDSNFDEIRNQYLLSNERKLSQKSKNSSIGGPPNTYLFEIDEINKTISDYMRIFFPDKLKPDVVIESIYYST